MCFSSRSQPASQPRGACYRVGFGWSLHPQLASIVALLSRLF
jgi:hypothetical protein